MDCRKRILSWILPCHISSFIWDRNNMELPNGSAIIILSFKLQMQWDDNFFSVAVRWQHRCSQSVICHSMKLLLLPTTCNQLCISCESCWLNSNGCAVFPTLGVYICWRWCSKAPLQKHHFFYSLIKKNTVFVWQLLKSHHQVLPILFCKYWAEGSASIQVLLFLKATFPTASFNTHVSVWETEIGRFELHRASIPSFLSTSHGMEAAQGNFSN